MGTVSGELELVSTGLVHYYCTGCRPLVAEVLFSLISDGMMVGRCNATTAMYVLDRADPIIVELYLPHNHMQLVIC